jgi:hypothetical protein
MVLRGRNEVTVVLCLVDPRCQRGPRQSYAGGLLSQSFAFPNVATNQSSRVGIWLNVLGGGHYEMIARCVCQAHGCFPFSTRLMVLVLVPGCVGQD